MKLFSAGASPYARKVLVAAVELGVSDRIEVANVHPHSVPAELVSANPLSKVPTLITDDGWPLYDSTAICLYLNSIRRSAASILPAIDTEQWTIWRRYSLANGLIDASVHRRVEGWRSPEPDRLAVIAKQKDVCTRALNALEADYENAADSFLIDSLALACALGFLDFRFPNDRWRENRPRLTEWYESAKMRRSLRETQPYD